MSKHLSTSQLRGLDRLGDVMLPGDADFAAFSSSKCGAEVDRILDYMPPADLGDLKLLLGIVAYLPKFLIGLALGFLERSASWGDWAAPLKFVRVGIRGLVMTLYYSHPQAHQVMNYRVGVYTEDLRGKAQFARLNEAPLQPPVGFGPTDNRSL